MDRWEVERGERGGVRWHITITFLYFRMYTRESGDGGYFFPPPLPPIHPSIHMCGGVEHACLRRYPDASMYADITLQTMFLMTASFVTQAQRFNHTKQQVELVLPAMP